MTTAEKAYTTVSTKMAEEGAQISKMFGMPTLKINGKAFAGFANEAMIFKLAAEAHALALQERGSKLFEPTPGRQMKEWVQVPTTSSNKWLFFAHSAKDYCFKSKK